jgi:hypothetical protein
MRNKLAILAIRFLTRFGKIPGLKTLSERLQISILEKILRRERKRQGIVLGGQKND